MKIFATLAKQLDDPSALFCGHEVESDVNTGWANLFKWIVLPGDPTVTTLVFPLGGVSVTRRLQLNPQFDEDEELFSF